MSTHRSRRFDRHAAEQLLRGETAASVEAEALAELLGAAAGPPGAEELAGESAALAAFRAARLDPALQPRRRSMIKTALAGLLTAKILVPAVAAATVGGVALATATGIPSSPEDVPSGPPAKVTTSRVPDSSPAGGPHSPEGGLAGVCTAYNAGAAERGKAMESMAFRVLVTKAGGKDKVAAYCADLLDDRPGKPDSAPSADPTTPAHRGGSPTERPTPPVTTPDHPAPQSPPEHPTGSPTEVPSPTHPAGP